jgi:chromatin structure-remodeling complex protein RSC7
MGVTEEDWMWRTAEETRLLDVRIRENREERLVELKGDDLRTWVYSMENLSEGKEYEEISLAVPDIKVVKEDLAGRPGSAHPDDAAVTPLPSTHEANVETVEEGQAEGRPANGEPNVEKVEANERVDRTPGGQVIVETEELRRRHASKYNWGLGSWQAGVVKAAYEVSSHSDVILGSSCRSHTRTCPTSLHLPNLNSASETAYLISPYSHRTPTQSIKTLCKAA